jgi:hypothetical protein
MKNLENLSVYEAEKQIREYLDTLYVRKPKEPLLITNKPTKEEIENYAKKVEQYNLDSAVYKDKNDLYKAESRRLWDLLEEKLKEDSGLNNIPEQYRDNVLYYAQQQGHGSSYSVFYTYLCELVEIFN